MPNIRQQGVSLNRRRWFVAGLVAGLASVALLAGLRGRTPWGYVPNWATRRKAWSVDLRWVTHVEMSGPVFRTENGNRWIIRDRREIARLLEALRRACRRVPYWREERQDFGGVPDHVVFCYGAPSADRFDFALIALSVREEFGPALEAATMPYHNKIWVSE